MLSGKFKKLRIFKKSLKTRILGILLLFSSFGLMVLWFSNWYFDRRTDVYSVGEQMNQINQRVSTDFNIQKEFFFREGKNVLFFKTGKSKLLENHEHIYQNIINSFHYLDEDLQTLGLDATDNLMACKRHVIGMDNTFMANAHVLRKRGFMKYGVVGEMKRALDRLEYEVGPNIYQVQDIRAAETEYMLSNKQSHVFEIRKKIKMLKASVEQGPYTEEQKILLNQFISDYKRNLDEYRRLGSLLGLEQQGGVLAQLNSEMEKYQIAYKKYKTVVEDWQESEFRFFQFLFLSGVGLYILLSILIGIFLAKRATESIVKLNKYIAKYVASNFTWKVPLEEVDNEDEVGELARNFKLLEVELDDHIENFQKKVSNRTSDLEDKNKELLLKNQKIDYQHQEILDSIRYGQRIQKAIMPSSKELTVDYRDHFLMYRPKDIVSGDFFWSYNDREHNKDRYYFALGDCTGHGVPGAFMSILGTNALYNILRKTEFQYPNEILTELNFRLREALGRKHDESSVNDGMDIAVCMIDFENELFHYSGAVIPLIYSKQGSLVEIPGDRASIGGEFAKNGFTYKRHTIPLNSMDSLYLFSDGLIDQFGGPKGKKFKKKNVIHQIEDMLEIGMSTQKVKMEERFTNWMKDEEQIDDVTMFGLNVKELADYRRGRKRTANTKRVYLRSTFDMLNKYKKNSENLDDEGSRTGT